MTWYKKFGYGGLEDAREIVYVENRRLAPVWLNPLVISVNV